MRIERTKMFSFSLKVWTSPRSKSEMKLCCQSTLRKSVSIITFEHTIKTCDAEINAKFLGLKNKVGEVIKETRNKIHKLKQISRP